MLGMVKGSGGGSRALGVFLLLLVVAAVLYVPFLVEVLRRRWGF